MNAGSGNETLSISGGGSLKVDFSFLGSATIGANSTLELNGSASGGPLAFAGTTGTLKIDGTEMPTNVFTGLQPSTPSNGTLVGDTIDLARVSFANGGSAQLLAGNVLQIVTGVGSGQHTYDLNLSPSADFSKESFKLSSDGNGGTDVQLSSTLSINVTYDQSVSSASNVSAIETAFNQVVKTFEADFSNPVTINVDVGWGEVDTKPIAAGDEANSISTSTADFSYGQIYTALSKTTSSIGQQAFQSLPNPSVQSNPFSNLSFSNEAGGAQALGLIANDSIAMDGWLGFATTPAQSWSFAGQSTPASSIDFIGTAEHELSEIMGRQTDFNTGTYSPTDLFRYSAPGGRDLTAAAGSAGPNLTAYFSIDGGSTNLGEWNNLPNNLPSGGDLADWYTVGDPERNDSFDYAGGPGPSPLSPNDLALMNAIGWNTFQSVVPNPVTLPAPALSVGSVPSGTRGQTLSLSSLVTITDYYNVGYQKLELWDSNGTVAGGQFVVNGTPQTGGHEIDVSPANVSGTVFDVGTLGGTDTLWAQLLQNNGQVTGWQPFTVTAPVARVPVSTVSSDPNAVAGQVVALSTLVTIFDPDNVGFQKLELWDSKGTAAGGQFVVNGTPQTGGHEIDVTPANVAGTAFDVGTAGGTDTLWAQLLQANGQLTGWQQFAVSVPLPTLTATSDPSATPRQVIPLSTLVTLSDSANVGYQKLELWDTNGTAASGQFVVNGTPQIGGHEIDVSPVNVSNTVFDAGTVAGADTLWARLLQNDGTLTTWMPFTVTVPAPSLSVHNDPTAAPSQVISLSTLVTISDPANIGYQKLELWDSKGTIPGGQFVVNGLAQTGGHEIDVTPTNVANTVFDTGITAGTDTLWAQLQQNDGTLTGWQPFTVTVPAPSLTVQNDSSATAGQIISLSTLVTVSDSANVGYQKLELWDSKGTAAGGQFVVNGVAQSGGHEIDVSPANVANTVFDAGTIGGTDTLWAQLQQNDGTVTGWQQFTVTVPAPSLTVHNDSGVTPSQVINLSTLVTISDPANVGYQKLELWDSNGTVAGGQFVVNGTPQTSGHEIDVTPANVANTVFDVGTTGASDTLWARLLQNDNTLTPWQQFTVKDPIAVAAGATVEISSAYAGAVTFAGDTGTLQLDNSASFNGTVAGMNGQDTIDFAGIDPTKVQAPSYSGDASGGTLSVSDGTHMANIALLGNYLASTFTASSDGHGGTNVVDPPTTGQVALLAQHA